MTWRVGRKVARTVYENDQIMFLCTTPEDAQRVVAELNQSDELRSQIQRERENADRLAGELKDRKCTCNGTGLQHKPGYTHYETDAGKECPAYHYGPCPRCELARAALTQHAALRSGKEDGNG